MFRAKTVLVLGAGASFEVGLPVGDRLLQTIVEMTHFSFEHWRQTAGDVQIVDALKMLLNEGGDVRLLNQHLQAGRQLGRSAEQALSIDNVIDALENPQIELLGKLGIVRAILSAEAASPKFRLNPDDRSIDLRGFSDTWYSSLTKLLREQVKLSQVDLVFENLEIINFNYDRCLEHYLQLSLASYYGIEAEAARAIVSRLPVHRPYGATGRLPWQDGGGPAVDYGSGGAATLAGVVEQIRTFTEQVEEGERLDAMRAALAGADRVVFLGFAFHRQNVQLLRTELRDEAEILATVLNISASDQDVIAAELAEAFGMEEANPRNRIELASVSCAELFRSYWRTLTAAKRDW